MSDTIFFISVIAGFIVILFVVIRFVKNDAVLLDGNGEPRGTRIFEIGRAHV